MPLLLAPYDSSMRLGQGFNSYTQQICIDDAVVIDSNKAEDIATKDAAIMRIMAQESAAPSAWTRQKEVHVESPATAVLVETAKKTKNRIHLIKQELAAEFEDSKSYQKAPVVLHLTGLTEAEPKFKAEDKPQHKKPKVKGGPKPEETKADQLEAKMRKEDEKSDLSIFEESSSLDELSDADEAREKVQARGYESKAVNGERPRHVEEREQQRAIQKEHREWDTKKPQEFCEAIENAPSLKVDSKEDPNDILTQNQYAEHSMGSFKQKQKYNIDLAAPRGPRRIVTYTSRFVDHLSDILDEMSVSSSPSIKAGKIGGSGKGSFIDSDKFRESDLNFYISVKVVTQTIDFKDTLLYNPLSSVDENNFHEVFGNTFISGFVEGGEFNALVSMKIINGAKKRDIQTQAKIALAVGAVQSEAEANVGVARSNIETNTETTIQVSWSGGGHITPVEQQWDIQSLVTAAARFPDFITESPHRTYAILTKYDSLRSFIAHKPAGYIGIQYENAQIYSRALLNTFFSYKALEKRLYEQIIHVQEKILEIQQWSDSEQQTVTTVPNGVLMMKKKAKNTSLYPYQEVNGRFEASLRGLSDARTAVHRQMARIVNKVDLIKKNPKLAIAEDHSEPYEAPAAFEMRIPTVRVPTRFRLHPLSGRTILAEHPGEEEQKKAAEEDKRIVECLPLFTMHNKLSEEEQAALQNAVDNNPLIGGHFCVSDAVGNESRGKYFNNLDYLKPDWAIRSIKTEMFEGALVYLAVSYENGLLVEKGATRNSSCVKKFGPFLAGERINSACIEYGRVMDGEVNDTQVLGLRLFTNRGRCLIARALHSETSEDKVTVTRDGKVYEVVKSLYLDTPFNPGSIKGFFGRSEDTPGTGKIWRLGIIWCRANETTLDETESQLGNVDNIMDSEDIVLLQKDQSLCHKSLKDTQTALFQAQEESSILRKQLEEANLSLESSRNDVIDRNGETERIKLEASEKLTQTIEPQCGRYIGKDGGWRPGDDCTALTRQTFGRTYSTVPKIIYGLAKIDMEQKRRNSALALDLTDISSSDFTLQISTFAGSYTYEIAASWMTLPDDLHLEHGSVNTEDTGETDWDIFSRRIYFNQTFTTEPKVCVWLQGFDYEKYYDFTSVQCQADGINPSGFTLRISSRASRHFRGARAGWFAYPADEDGKRVCSGRGSVSREQTYLDQRWSFNADAFSKTPATFFAISEIDFGRDTNLRAVVNGKALNREEFSTGFGTWSDSNMNHIDVTWIAIV